MADTRKLGALFAAARRQAGITQAELAGRVGTSVATIAQYEQGFRRPSLLRVMAIAEALGVSPASFFTTDPLDGV